MAKKEKTVDPDEYVENPVPQPPKRSFATENDTLTLTDVNAPYVRKVSEKTGKNGDVVTKFDIRLTQPNVDTISSAALHTITHLVSEFFYSKFENTVDISPNGSQTGIKIIMMGELSEETIAQTITQAMSFVATWGGHIPGSSKEHCGNAESHDLHEAKKVALMFIGGIVTKGYGA